MFRPMTAIFSRAGYLGLLLVFLLGCAEQKPDLSERPNNAARVIEPFLNELRAGNREKAAAYVAPTAMDEFEQQFDKDHKALSALPPLTSQLWRNEKPKLGDRPGAQASTVYAVRKDGKWTSVYLRTYKDNGGPIKIEYWRVSNTRPELAMRSNAEAQALKQSQFVLFWTFAGLAVFGLAGLALLFWIIRRKPHLVVNEAPSEERRAASTVRDE
jgi:hypothetical protein